MLRNPIDRVLSNYYYIKRPNHPKNTMIKNMSIEEFVTLKEKSVQFLVFNTKPLRNNL